MASIRLGPQNRLSSYTSVKLKDRSESFQLAVSIAKMADIGDVIGLMGPIGIGKTAFARAFIRSISDPNEIVPSPTYTLMQLYDSGAVPIYHYDLYRIQTEIELEELGLDTAAAEGITLIEWPDRVGALGGHSRLNIKFEASEGGSASSRTVSFEGGASWETRLKNMLRGFVGKPYE